MSMLSVQVIEWGQPPRAVRALPPPTPTHDTEVQIRVLAAGLHNVVRSRASGRHYSAGDRALLPHTLGVDGVGVDISTGATVYFSALGDGEGDGGSFAELVNVRREDVVPVPEGVDVVQAAGLMNPVLSSWMALRKRVDFLREGRKEGWTCLIMGVTSMSGRLAIKVARAMGASKVYGAARNEERMKTLALDGYILLKDDPSTTDFSAAASADVVLDYLYGPYMTAFLVGTVTSTHPLTYVCIGSLAGNWANIPSAALRRRDVTIRGSGIGAWAVEDTRGEVEGMLDVLRGVYVGDEVRVFGMGDVEGGMKGDGRVVLVTEAYEGAKGV